MNTRTQGQKILTEKDCLLLNNCVQESNEMKSKNAVK